MELVPIIVSALKIVAALAVVVITFSYVTYKIKLKKGVIEPPEKRMAQPVVYAEKSVKKIVERITKHIPSEQPAPNINQKVEKKVKLNPSTQRPVKSIESKNLKRQSKLENTDRIEVVKSLSPKSETEDISEKKSVRHPTKEKKSTEEKNMSSLGDQILDKYSEGESEEMFTLNTRKDANKKK